LDLTNEPSTLRANTEARQSMKGESHGRIFDSIV
jgi:hypothetical protein